MSFELKIPKHVAIICDGNRRWAKSKGLSKLQGHKKGADNVEKLGDAARDLGIEYLTCWVLSTENREERDDEVPYMMDIARDFFKKYRQKAIKEEIRFRHLGRKDRFPEDITKLLRELEEDTKDFTKHNFSIAMNYGGRDELIRMIKKLSEDNREITKETIVDSLDTKGMPEPDLVIRTGGKVRLSGFMPWQTVYSEFYFTEILFPAFDKDELIKSMEYFSGVGRNFGK